MNVSNCEDSHLGWDYVPAGILVTYSLRYVYFYNG